MVNHDGEIFIFEVLVEQVAELRLGSDQMDAHRQASAGENRPPDLRLWSFVGTYGVERNVNEHGCSIYLTASLMSRTARPL
jgi:hypothetical protein